MTDKNKKLLKILIIVLIAVFLTLIVSGAVYMHFMLKNSDRVADGVTVFGIDLSGMTRVGARAAIRDNLPDESENKNIELVCGTEILWITTDELSPEINVPETVDNAFEYGKTGTKITRIKKLIKAKLEGYEIRTAVNISDDIMTDILAPFSEGIENPFVPASYVVEPDRIVIIPGKSGMGVDREKLKNDISDCMFRDRSRRIELSISECKPTVYSAEKLHDIFACEPENAEYIKDENGNIRTTDGRIGVEFNIKTAQKIIDKSNGTECYIPIIATKPDITPDLLMNGIYKDELSNYSSSYVVSNSGRVKNLELSCSKLNGTELLPGEVFSYVGAVGNGTYEEGYVDAPIYADGEVVTGVAGGICQGSSTLYCAVLYADLKIVERVNHSMPVGYVPAGMDATIATPYIDFRFENSTDYPLKIEASCSGGTMKIRLLGVVSEPDKEIEITNKKIETIPFETKKIESENLNPGEEKIKQNGSDGSVVETYKTVKIGEKEQSTVKISTSRYEQIPKIIETGKEKNK